MRIFCVCSKLLVQIDVFHLTDHVFNRNRRSKLFFMTIIVFSCFERHFPQDKLVLVAKQTLCSLKQVLLKNCFRIRILCLEQAFSANRCFSHNRSSFEQKQGLQAVFHDKYSFSCFQRDFAKTNQFWLQNKHFIVFNKFR